MLFFEHKKMYRSVRGDVPASDYTVPLGKAEITHPGTQITVIAYGLMAHYALEAADRVAEDGISVEVVDLRTLRPLDKETMLDSVRKTGKCLVVYEDNRFGGYGAEIARSSPRRRSTTSTARSRASPVRTCPACPTTTSSRTGSWSTPRRSPPASGSSPRTRSRRHMGGASGGASAGGWTPRPRASSKIASTASSSVIAAPRAAASSYPVGPSAARA